MLFADHRETMLNQLIVSAKKGNSSEGGFTLVELMVTIAVLAIIVSIAAPSMSRQLAEARMKNTASVIDESLKSGIAESSIQRQALTYQLDGSNSNVNTISLTNPNASAQSKTYHFNKTTTVEVVAVGHGKDNSQPKEYTFKQSDTFKIGPGKRISDMPGKAGVVEKLEFRICDVKVTDNKKWVVSINMVGQVRQMKSSEDCS